MPTKQIVKHQKKQNSFGREAVRQILLCLFLLAVGFGMGVAASSASNIYRTELQAVASGGSSSAPASYAR